MIRYLNELFPNVVPSLEAHGIQIAITHHQPRPCEDFPLRTSREIEIDGTDGASHEWSAEDPESDPARGLPHGDARGVYCPAQRLAWADTGSSWAVVPELFHAVDHVYRLEVGAEPTAEHKAALRRQFGFVSPHYGLTYTSMDPQWYALWMDYRKRTWRPTCILAPQWPILGCQGHDDPVELFMEVGIQYLYYPTRLKDTYPELVDYFVRVMFGISEGYPPELRWQALNALRHQYREDTRRAHYYSDVILRYFTGDEYVLNLLSRWKIGKNDAKAIKNLVQAAKAYPEYKYLVAASLLKATDLYAEFGEEAIAGERYRLLLDKHLRGPEMEAYRAQAERGLARLR